MADVSYSTAVLARAGGGWRAVDVDPGDAESLDELADLLRGASRGGPVLAVLEREDEWFAFVRVDGEDEARSFVSDLRAAELSRYGDLLAPVGDVELPEYEHLREPRSGPAHPDVPGADVPAPDLGPAVAWDAGSPPTADAAPGGAADAQEPASGAGLQGVQVAVADPPAWAGDPGLLADVGIEADELVELVVDGDGDPASVVARVGERCGFDELLDALR